MQKRKDTIEKVLDPDRPPAFGGVQAFVERLKQQDSRADFYGVPLILNESRYLFKFRYPKTTGDLRNFDREATQFIARCQDPSKLPPAFKDALGIRELDTDDLVSAFYLSWWSYQTEKIDEVQALTMVALDPVNCKTIIEQVERVVNKSGIVLSFGGFEEKKSDLKRTTSSNSDSKRQEPTSGSTPTT